MIKKILKKKKIKRVNLIFIIKKVNIIQIEQQWIINFINNK